MSTNIVEKSRRKSVFGRNSKATLVVSALDGPCNQSAGDGHQQDKTASTACPAVTNSYLLAASRIAESGMD